MNFNYYTWMLIAYFVLVKAEDADRNHKKRQIYREEVLPHAGGKIPDTAFETHRLFLNRLQKEGIAVPDGVVPEQRQPQVYPFFSKPMRNVYHVALSSDARFTPREGRYEYQNLPSVETTYLYPQIHGQGIDLKPPNAVLPIYTQFQLHNPLLNQAKFHFKPKSSSKSNNFGKYRPKPSTNKALTYQNFNMISIPIVPLRNDISKSSASLYNHNRHYLPNYASSELLNDFDAYFNEFDLHKSSHRLQEHIQPYSYRTFK